MIKVSGTLTTATVKPRTTDKDGAMKNEEYLALTFKVPLGEFTDAELGNLLITSARGDEVGVSVEPKQIVMEIPPPDEAIKEAKEQGLLEVVEQGEVGNANP